ncbi:hypothetical protein X797_010948 [Metarhizium robertsii]|uniref:Uncharacterized protein n=2 Tax=Metarhizium robertsii TaxID=568076 RepID=E9FCF9_METRA|nr:uncharacterized protein MAA_09958 [Metarhizium robertsii ARSEF 23]EFY94587.1 hypothetical protein MAA_09958 [Metarhizium robertsii ARSEF 23]EXU95990.1 hypothetical protein X797_010948 [Metarhizium robertsii]
MTEKSRQSNADRRRERDKCRLKLSQHINERLGIIVKPSEVRLNPRFHDAYVWRPFPGHEKLYAPIFGKNLSDHSIGTYRLLAEQVGGTFEATHRETTLGDAEGTTLLLSNVQPSFSVEIERLTTENRGLSEQICQLSSALATELEQRKVAEEDNKLLYDKLRLAENQLQQYSHAASCAQEMFSKTFAEMENSLSILAEIRQETDMEIIKGLPA